MAKSMTALLNAYESGEILTDGENNKKIAVIKVDDDAYKNFMDEKGITLDIAQSVHKAEGEYVAKIAKETHTLAVEKMNENTEIDVVNIIAPFGSDKLTSATSNVLGTVQRSVRVPGNKDVFQPSIRYDVNVKSHNLDGVTGKEIKSFLQSNLK